MKKRIITIAIAMFMLIGMAIPVQAAENPTIEEIWNAGIEILGRIPTIEELLDVATEILGRHLTPEEIREIAAKMSYEEAREIQRQFTSGELNERLREIEFRALIELTTMAGICMTELCPYDIRHPNVRLPFGLVSEYDISVWDSAREDANDPRTATPEQLRSLEHRVWLLINNVRIYVGISNAYDWRTSLWWDDTLAAAARRHSMDIARNGTIDGHTGSDGSTHISRVRDADTAGVITGYVTEIVGIGQFSVADVMRAWLSSDGHNETIFTPNHRTIGVGIAVYNGRVVWTAIFSDSIPTSVQPSSCGQHTVDYLSFMNDWIPPTPDCPFGLFTIIPFEFKVIIPYGFTPFENSWVWPTEGRIQTHNVHRLRDGRFLHRDGTITDTPPISGAPRTTTAPATPTGTATTPAMINPFNEIMVLVDRSKVGFDVHPIIQNGRTLVPMRAIFEALGAEVHWDAPTQDVSARRPDGVLVAMTIGQNIMRVGPEQVTLDVAPQIINGRTLVPVRAIAEAFGAEVEWYAEQRIVIITTGNASAPAATGTNQPAPAQPNAPTTTEAAQPDVPAASEQATTTITFTEVVELRTGNIGMRVTYTRTNGRDRTTSPCISGRAMNVRVQVAVPFTMANDNGILVITANGETFRLTEGQSITLTS